MCGTIELKQIPLIIGGNHTIPLEHKKTLPIVEDDFRDIRERNKYYVDKTLMIQDYIQSDNKFTLITRPHRFVISANFKTGLNNRQKGLRLCRSCEVFFVCAGGMAIISF